MAEPPFRIAILGPGSEPADGVPADVRDEIARLTRPGISVAYRFVGGGPAAIRSGDDVREMEPFVVRAAERAEAEGFDAVVVDCTDDPGVVAARRTLAIPVVGAGEALRAAIARSPGVVIEWSGDELRQADLPALLADVRAGATIALGGTGWSHLVDELELAGHTVIDPLPEAVARCLPDR